MPSDKNQNYYMNLHSKGYYEPIKNDCLIEILWPDNHLSVHFVMTTTTQDSFYDRDADFTFHSTHYYPIIRVCMNEKACLLDLHKTNEIEMYPTWAKRTEEETQSCQKHDDKTRLYGRLIQSADVQPTEYYKPDLPKYYTEEMSNQYLEKADINEVKLLTKTVLELPSSFCPTVFSTPSQCRICAHQLDEKSFDDQPVYRFKYNEKDNRTRDIFTDYKLCPHCQQHKFWCGKFFRNNLNDVELLGGDLNNKSIWSRIDDVLINGMSPIVVWKKSNFYSIKKMKELYKVTDETVLFKDKDNNDDEDDLQYFRVNKAK
jgi:hypothetical protein